MPKPLNPRPEPLDPSLTALLLGLGFEVLKQKTGTLESPYPGSYQALMFWKQKHMACDMFNLNLIRPQRSSTNTTQRAHVPVLKLSEHCDQTGGQSGGYFGLRYCIPTPKDTKQKDR